MALSIEKQSLEAHVDLCAERYEGLRKDLENMSDRIDKMESEMTTRMDKLDSGIEDIKDKLSSKETSALKTLIAVGFSAIVGLIGVCGGLLWYIIMNR
jgi:DNA anti-recombination protein RmuC